MTGALLIVAAGLAIGDWTVVHLRLFRLEYLLKPATLAVLIAAAAGADIDDGKAWVVAALAFGLLGDIALMLSRDGRTDPAFLAGLAAFLLGHVAYIGAFLAVGVHGLRLLAGLLVVLGVTALALPGVLRGAAGPAGRDFARIVAGYAGVLAAMTALGIGTGIVATAIGAAVFLCSDTLLARQRFVAPVAHGPLLVTVTYHLAQFLIVLGLVNSF